MVSFNFAVAAGLVTAVGLLGDKPWQRGDIGYLVQRIIGFYRFDHFFIAIHQSRHVHVQTMLFKNITLKRLRNVITILFGLFNRPLSTHCFLFPSESRSLKDKPLDLKHQTAPAHKQAFPQLCQLSQSCGMRPP